METGHFGAPPALPSCSAPLGTPGCPSLREEDARGGGGSRVPLLSRPTEPRVSQQRPQGSTGSSGWTPQRSRYPQRPPDHGDEAGDVPQPFPPSSLQALESCASGWGQQMALREVFYPSESSSLFAFFVALGFWATKLSSCTKSCSHLLFLISKAVSAFSRETSARLRIVQNTHGFGFGNLEPDGFLSSSQIQDQKKIPPFGT